MQPKQSCTPRLTTSASSASSLLLRRQQLKRRGGKGGKKARPLPGVFDTSASSRRPVMRLMRLDLPTFDLPHHGDLWEPGLRALAQLHAAGDVLRSLDPDIGRPRQLQLSLCCLEAGSLHYRPCHGSGFQSADLIRPQMLALLHVYDHFYVGCFKGPKTIFAVYKNTAEHVSRWTTATSDLNKFLFKCSCF